MKPTRIAPLVAALALLAAPVLAQQPPPPAPAEPPAGEAAPTPTPPPGDAPPPPSSSAPSTDKKLKVTEDEVEEKESEPEVQWGVGVRSRFITTPRWLIELFVEHGTKMTSVSFAGEVIRRKGNFDLVFSLEWEKVAPDDGLYEEKGETPNQEDMYPDYYEFDSNFSFLSLDVSFLWHFDLTDFMSVRLGPGVGLGVPFNSWKHQDAVCDSTTINSDLDDPNTTKCRRKEGAPIEVGDLPPVMPVVNLLVGLRFKIVDELSFQIEGGWRLPSFFVGAGLGYFF